MQYPISGTLILLTDKLFVPGTYKCDSTFNRIFLRTLHEYQDEFVAKIENRSDFWRSWRLINMIYRFVMTKKNFMVWVRERPIATERPPLVGEVTANFCGKRVPRGQRDGSLRPYSRFTRQEPLLFYQVAPQLYSVVLFFTFKKSISYSELFFCRFLITLVGVYADRLCGYRSGGPGSFPGTIRKQN
jgi:hypothetical protein